MHRLDVETHSSDADTAEINLSPLIDMVFLLLIFFMVTTVFVEETGVDVQKPVAASATKLNKNSILLAVTPRGDIVHEGRALALNAVRGLVARQLRDGVRPVIILADRVAHTGVVVDVIDECKRAGAETVSIAARQE